MRRFRDTGCTRFAVVGTSYGGWIAALVSFLEPQIEFLGLLQPVTDLEQAIWRSPASKQIRIRLARASIPAGITLKHAHLSSPLAAKPLCDPNRVLIVAGKHDLIVPLEELKELQRTWGIPRLVEIDQGHFGYRAMNVAMHELARRTDERQEHCGRGVSVHRFICSSVHHPAR
jgi:pimeloyl-ACP methyl ester carboxylesterase